MILKQIGSRGLAIILSLLLGNVPQILNAQAATPPQGQQAPQSQQNGTNAGDPEAPEAQRASQIPDPAQAPLAPVLSAHPAGTNNTPPDAPSEVQRAQQPQTPTPATSEAPLMQQQQPTTPLGTATAQQGATRGGAASKPAGEAIAPAKQRQVHSMLIRLGLVAAGAAAVGTVVALTRGTSSIPPGAH